MANSKIIIGAVVAVAAIAVAFPLLSRDRKALMGTPNAPAQGTQGAGPQRVLGYYNGKPLTFGELSSEELDTLYKGEIALYNATKDLLVKKYLDSYFEKLAGEKNLKNPQEARDSYLKQNVKVSQAQVDAFLKENQDNPGLQRIPEGERSMRVREFLESRDYGRVLNELVDKAIEKSEITINAPQPVKPRYTIAESDNYYLGPKDAKVTIVEFADFQCPYCARMVPTLTELVKKYDGKVRWVYRDFPLLQIHPEALPAAVAARCAGKQGKFFEMHGLLFQNYSKLGQELYMSLAKDIKIDTQKFESCLKDQSMRAVVLADMESGVKYGVNGTPAYFVNGVKMAGGMGVGEFSKVIDEELEKIK